jgi:hypothetical protein
MDLWHPSLRTDHPELMEPFFPHYLLSRRRLNRFQRATETDTKVEHEEKNDPADISKTRFGVMMRGDGDVVPGWKTI